ncbi:hypothetical protein Gotur_002865, partial [Gossypium turneri]
EDRILQCHIRNLPSPPSLLTEPYLREANFWHVAFVGRGCKLDLKLISAWWRGGDLRRIYSIFHAASVLSLWKTCIYSWGYPWTGQ